MKDRKRIRNLLFVNIASLIVSITAIIILIEINMFFNMMVVSPIQILLVGIIVYILAIITYTYLD